MGIHFLADSSLAGRFIRFTRGGNGFRFFDLVILHQLVERLFPQVLEVVLAKFIERAFVMQADPVFDTSSEAKSLCLEDSFFLANELEPKGR